MIVDEKEVKKALELIHPNGQLFEVRLIKDKKIISGYFTNHETMIKQLKNLHFENANVYVVLNEIDDACYSRTQRDVFLESKNTTSDSDIINRKFFFVDVDPRRATGTSSTNEELESAHELQIKVCEYLDSLGFEKPIIALSGNGYHLLYKIDVPNTAEINALIEDCIKVLVDVFSNYSKVDIDTTISNASRICKLSGTYARKGSNTEKRPHRLSRIISVPDELKETPIEKLELLASQLHKVDQSINRNKHKKNYKSAFDLDTFLYENGITYKICNKTGRDGSKIYALDVCPFNPSHVDGDAKIFQYSDSAISFKCHHNGCSYYKWQDLRMMFDKDYTPDADYEHNEHKNRISLNEEIEPPFDFTNYDSISADKIDLSHNKEPIVIVDGLVVEGTDFFVAPPKGGKSRAFLQMCLDIVNGRKFLNHFETHRCEVLYLALEDDFEKDFKKRLKTFLGDETLPPGLHIMCGDHFPYIDDKSKIRRIPRLGKSGGLGDYIRSQIAKYPKIKLVCIDVFGLVRSVIDAKERIDFIEHERRDITELISLSSDLEIAILVSHHVAKGSINSVRMSDTSIGSGAGSYALSGTAHGEISLIRDSKDRTLATLRVEGRRLPSSAVVVRDCYPRWEFVSTLSDYVKEQKENDEYEETSAIVETVIYLVERDGTWRGTAKQFQAENESNTELPMLPKAVNKNSFNQLVLHQLKNNGITYKQLKNGTAPINHMFSKISDSSTVIFEDSKVSPEEFNNEVSNIFGY